MPNIIPRSNSLKKGLQWPQLIYNKWVLTVGAHANSLLQGLQMSDHDSPRNHMMTATMMNQAIKANTIKGMYRPQTMNNFSTCMCGCYTHLTHLLDASSPRPHTHTHIHTHTHTHTHPATPAPSPGQKKILSFRCRSYLDFYTSTNTLDPVRC